MNTHPHPPSAPTPAQPAVHWNEPLRLHGAPPRFGQAALEDLFVPMPPLNASTFAAAVAVTSFLAMVTVLS